MEALPSAAGMYLVAWLRKGITGTASTQAANAAGVGVMPLSLFSIGPLVRDGLVLGYGAYDVGQIRTAVKALARALRGIQRATRWGIRHTPQG